jgi:hypothetical protein
MQAQQIRKREYAKAGWKDDNEAPVRNSQEMEDTEMAL